MASSQLFSMALQGHEKISSVSYPSKQISVGDLCSSKQISAGYHNPNINFCGYFTHVNKTSVEYATCLNKFLWGLTPLGTNFDGVSDRSAQNYAGSMSISMFKSLSRSVSMFPVPVPTVSLSLSLPLSMFMIRRILNMLCSWTWTCTRTQAWTRTGQGDRHRRLH